MAVGKDEENALENGYKLEWWSREKQTAAI